MKAILSISTFFLFIFVVFSSVAKEYEIGSIEAKGMTCKWFSSIKQNCTKEAVQKKNSEFSNCLTQQQMKEAKSCKNKGNQCYDELFRRAFSYCCNKTKGVLK